MPNKPYPTKMYFPGDFAISAGCILFRRHPETKTLQVCLIYHRETQEWLLPKGHKDRGESIEVAAIRETYEETGYPCELLPVRMATRAPPPGVPAKEAFGVFDGITEPFSIHIREPTADGTKCILWYIAEVKDGADKVEGTQTAWENFDSAFVDAEEAVTRATFQTDKTTIQKAIEIVRDTDNGRALL